MTPSLPVRIAGILAALYIVWWVLNGALDLFLMALVPALVISVLWVERDRIREALGR